ncbi:MAG TPA: permease-like cell division protein FtsX [Bacteroidales bacterium]|jgi:cell division transport system permease protein|nr:permease-like cell division protein FtsX [Bacteroidales bacterium]
MALQEERYYQRRIATSQFTTIISITLVLFLLGLLGMIILHAQKLSDYVKENIGFSIIMREGVRESGILELKKNLDRAPYVKSAEYIPPDRAAEKLQDELGEDFVGFLGYNPLLPSIDLRIKAAYTVNDSLTRIERQLLQRPEVKEVFYQKSLVDAINRNLEKISLILLGFSAILLFIAIVLINNTIRLSVYSKRFLIRSMQLVGATEGFIRKPFLSRSILHGTVSALVALGILMVMLYFALDQIPELLELQDPVMLIGWAVFIVLLGVFISWSSTYFAVRKYLRIRTDLLYT